MNGPPRNEGRERACKWNAFDRTIIEVRGQYFDVSMDDLEAIIDEAVAVARKGSMTG